VAAGLGTPREPIQLTAEGRLVNRGHTADHTDLMVALPLPPADLLRPSWSPADIVGFHARHKLQLLAHDPARYRRAGRVVAAAGSAPRAQTEVAYRDLFLAAMAGPANTRRIVNALQHAYSRIGRELDRPRRLDLLAQIEAYRRGEQPLSVPVALLSHYASGGEFGWLAEQAFLRPFPAGLRPHHAASAAAG
jgi:uncharacterized protein YbgA (DUF1722 family)